MKISATMMATGATGSILQSLNDNAPAYGLIGSWVIGGLGFIGFMAFGILRAIRERNHNKHTLEERKRHNAAQEKQLADEIKTRANSDTEK